MYLPVISELVDVRLVSCSDNTKDYVMNLLVFLPEKELNGVVVLIRPEATGYGQVYFAEEMLKTRGDSMKGKICTVSGSGNVAQYCTEKATELGAKVVTLSDSQGYIYDPDGIDKEKLEYVM